MAIRSRTFLALAFLFFVSASFPPSAFPLESLRREEIHAIEEATRKALQAGQVSGAVLLIGNRNDILYRRAFGFRTVMPKKVAMTIDTIFDLASLTKVVATTTALMQLVETEAVNLDAPVVRYWPEFCGNGKEGITLRHLLTHYSGLRPGLDLKPYWFGYEEGLRKITEEKCISPPGSRFLYSDINFQILGEIIRRVSGQTLDRYCQDLIFTPLGMKDTFFRPPPDRSPRIAPAYRRKDPRSPGMVHDEVAFRMGGVTGHAGLFSTADDLSLFARMILNKGSLRGVRVLSPSSVEQMMLPQSPADRLPLRGLGWDLEGPFASNRDSLLPLGSCSHTGFTGTAIWIDPISEVYIVLLTNRLHPTGKGNVHPLRSQILSMISGAVGEMPPELVFERSPSLKDVDAGNSQKKVMTGLEVLAENRFRPLTGLRVGLITNHTGVDSWGRRSIDLLYRAQGVKLVRLFSPEHGLSGNLEGKVPHTKDPQTGLPVWSLYGLTLKPSGKMLDGLDALVFDIQDAGVRFFTYITTMGYAMEAAAKRGLAFYLLDRPNPLTGIRIQGPMADKEMESFTSYFPLPVRHGMTVGELAQMFNEEKGIGVKLHVIRMIGYQRANWYDETGLRWLNLSPNLRSLTQVILYPGVAMIEGANVSVGRGTETPFELVGAPWVSTDELAQYLSQRQIQGVRFRPAHFVPQRDRFKGQVCRGVQIVLDDRDVLDSPALGIEIASAFHRLYPRDFQIEKTIKLMGSRWLVDAIGEMDPRLIVKKWEESLGEFRRLRSKYLLY